MFQVDHNGETKNFSTIGQAIKFAVELTKANTGCIIWHKDDTDHFSLVADYIYNPYTGKFDIEWAHEYS